MTDSAGDERLIVAVATGDLDAFGPFYERFSRPVYALGLRWLQDAADAEDLVSETFIRAWQQSDRFDGQKGAASAWLFGIARHVALDHWRSRKRHSAGRLEDAVEPRQDRESEAVCQAFDLSLALGRLAPIHQQVLLLTYAHEQTETEISENLGIPLGTEKSRRFNALRQMAGLLGDVRYQPDAAGVRTS